MDRLPTILVVEDHPRHLMLISSAILKPEGYNVIEATNIDDAIKQIQQFQDGAANVEGGQREKENSQTRLIVIIDVGIPQSSGSLTLKRGGIDLLKYLHEHYSETPVILLTIYAEANDVRKEAQKYDAVIISKPLEDPDQLLRVIQDISVGNNQ